MRECKECANYQRPSCPYFVEGKGILIGKRVELVEDYDVDCFQTREDKQLCDMMCGKIERW